MSSEFPAFSATPQQASTADDFVFGDSSAFAASPASTDCFGADDAFEASSGLHQHTLVSMDALGGNSGDAFGGKNSGDAVDAFSASEILKILYYLYVNFFLFIGLAYII